MPKNIVICCDGTGNEFGNANSNVVKLYSTLTINQRQVGYYHPGVGTMGAPTARNWLDKKWTQIKGLAFGAGLLDNVADAYRYLMDVYADGDQIFLFGFSRGAYTARVLGGVLHKYGLLCPGNGGHIPYIMRMYARQRRSAGRATKILRSDDEFKWTFSRSVRLHFVGVWDTVSSVGWVYDPIKLPFTGSNPIIDTGRQAISIDERRCFYMPLLWAEPTEANKQDVKQVWFKGVHSDVGGGYPEEGSQLSKVTLEWMLNEAVQKGLQIDPAKARCILGKGPKCAEYLPDFVPANSNMAPHQSLRGPWWLLELLPHRYDATEYDGKGVSWRIPLGAYRKIPKGAHIYEPDLMKVRREQLFNEGDYDKEQPIDFTPYSQGTR